MNIKQNIGGAMIISLFFFLTNDHYFLFSLPFSPLLNSLFIYSSFCFQSSIARIHPKKEDSIVEMRLAACRARQFTKWCCFIFSGGYKWSSAVNYCVIFILFLPGPYFYINKCNTTNYYLFSKEKLIKLIVKWRLCMEHILMGDLKRSK